MFKNVASQKIVFVAWDSATGLLKTGDAANLTAYVSKDGGSVTVLGDTSASEMDATNAKGCYSFDVAQSESNGDMLLFTCKSSTSGIQLDPVLVFTDPANFTKLVIDSNGLTDANAVKVGPSGSGTAQTARDLGANLDAAVSSRMATYAQPSGFLAATFPTGTIANTTNITAGTITTVTNLTNAPTAGDLTATMKTSVTTAATAATPTAAAVTASVTVGAINAAALADLFDTNSGTTYGAAVAGSVVKEIADNAGGSALTAGGIADAVWDEAISGHLGAGSTGNALNAAGSYGDPWATSLPGAYGAGTAGKIIGDKIVASVTGSVGSVTGNVGGNVTGSVGSVVAPVAITSNIKQNQALVNFPFLMTDSTNHAPATGKTPTCTRRIDGGAFSAGTLANVTETANGMYSVDFGAADLNGKLITLRATAPGCDDTFERIFTQP